MSAGPKCDIVVPYAGHKTGFLARTCNEYADALHAILSLNEASRVDMQVGAAPRVYARAWQWYGVVLGTLIHPRAWERMRLTCG